VRLACPASRYPGFAMMLKHVEVSMSRSIAAAALCRMPNLLQRRGAAVISKRVEKVFWSAETSRTSRKPFVSNRCWLLGRWRRNVGHVRCGFQHRRCLCPSTARIRSGRSLGLCSCLLSASTGLVMMVQVEITRFWAKAGREHPHWQ